MGNPNSTQDNVYEQFDIVRGFVLNKKDAASAVKEFEDLLAQNRGTVGAIHGNKICRLYLDLTERYGTQFSDAVEEKLRKEYVNTFKSIEPELYDMQINALDEELKALDPHDADAKKQYIDRFYSVMKSVNAAGDSYSSATQHDWAKRKLQRVAMDTSAKIGKEFWGNAKTVGDGGMQWQLTKCKEGISNAGSAERAAEIFGDALEMWKVYYRDHASSKRMPERAEQAAMLYSFARKKFGNEFAEKFGETLSKDNGSPENALIGNYIEKVSKGEFIEKKDNFSELSPQRQALEQKRTVNELINDIEKTDAKEAIEAFDGLLRISYSERPAEEVCFLYQKMAEKYGEPFEQAVGKSLWRDSIYKGVLQKARAKELSLKLRDLIDSTPGGEPGAVTEEFKKLIAENEQRQLYTPEEFDELYRNAGKKFGSSFTDAVEGALQESPRFKAGKQYLETSALALNNKETSEVLGAFDELLAQNKATGVVSGADICKLYINLAERYGKQFYEACEKNLRETYGDSFKKIEADLFGIRVNDLAKDLEALDASDKEAGKQYAAQYRSLEKSLNSAVEASSNRGAFADAWKKLHIVGMDASARIGKDFWGAEPVIDETAMNWQLTKCKESIGKAESAEEAEKLFADTLEMWGKYYEGGMERISNASADPDRQAAYAHNMRLVGDNAVRVILSAEERFGNEFTERFADLFSDSEAHPDKSLLGTLTRIQRAKELDAKLKEYKALDDDTARAESAKKLAGDFVDALGKPGNTGELDKYLGSSILNAVNEIGDPFVESFKEALEEKPDLKNAVYSGEEASMDGFIARLNQQKAANLQADIDKYKGPFTKYAKALQEVSRISDSGQFKQLRNVLSNLSKNSLNLIDPETKMIKDEYKGLTDSQLKALPYVLVHKAIDQYLEHKSRDGVNRNAYDKMDVVERLNRFVSGKIEKLNPGDFRCDNPDKSKAPLDFQKGEAHKYYAGDYLAAQEYVSHALENGQLRNIPGGARLYDAQLLKDTSNPEGFGAELIQNDYDKLGTVKSCMDRIMLKAQIANLEKNAALAVNESLKSPVPSHLEKANEELLRNEIAKKEETTAHKEITTLR